MNKNVISVSGRVHLPMTSIVLNRIIEYLHWRFKYIDSLFVIFFILMFRVPIPPFFNDMDDPFLMDVLIAANYLKLDSSENLHPSTNFPTGKQTVA